METLSNKPTSTETPPKSSCWFKKSLIALVVILAALAAVIAMQPNEFRVTRTATFDASPEEVFEQINDFHNWEAWSPWAKLDPDAKTDYEGPTSGEGAIFRWDGDSNVGQGSMTLVQSKPNDLIRIKLDFKRPMEGTSDVKFTIKPEGDKTALTWSMEGENNFMAKAVGLVVDCEKMCGDMFEDGFANLKHIVEGTPNE
mgnify:CR=1 FL=1